MLKAFYAVGKGRPKTLSVFGTNMIREDRRLTQLRKYITNDRNAKFCRMNVAE